ncbi:MAG: DUF262 domain-containing HNH endonuclease family protein [Tannerellaceae bacterium]|nr:DUF262 domain-containing HNH endonuclease family protein [Tannerellaceae bacterium]
MEASTSIKGMLAKNKIVVPTYQRAYSWDTEFDKSQAPKQVNVFLSDLEEYNQSETKSKYYFGHFLFEQKAKCEFGIVDGQQRLTTVVIFLSALFRRIKELRKLTEEEEESFQQMIKWGSTYNFTTVDYDDRLFKDYVIDQCKCKKDTDGLETESAKRIVNAFNYFVQQLEDKDELYLTKMLETIQNSSCTTHPVTDESEAIQMFIFQNNRGKKPSNLEIIKAQFMFNVHLYANVEEKISLIDEIKDRFGTVYKRISSIECKIHEDDVLLYTQRVYFDSLWESNTLDKINKELEKEERINFIREFTRSLGESFDYLAFFLNKNEKEHIDIHALVSLGGFSIVMPFIITAYKTRQSVSEICKLCKSLESILLRHRLIGTRAELESRLNGVFKEFNGGNKTIDEIVTHINWMKTEKGWWGYWSNTELLRTIQGWIHPTHAKFLLWKYENYLIQQEGKAGYALVRFDYIAKPHLEHIAPKTKNGEKEADGYCEYDEEFRNQYIDCLGNYLLLSAPHNVSIGNRSFIDVKRPTYTQLRQQVEVYQMTEEDRTWNKEKITKRKEKIIEYIMNNI